MASRCPATVRATICALAVCALGLSGCVGPEYPGTAPVYSGGPCDWFAGPPAAPAATPTPAPRPERPAQAIPGPRQPWHTVDLLLSPREVVAPVGREVILLAGVRGTGDHLRTNERIEWMLEPGGVGQFVALDEGTWSDPFVGDFTDARKIDNTRAIATTSRKLVRLTRGTEDPADDVEVLRGQTWVTVTSPAEGVSHVTVVAPDVYAWRSRQQTAVIHWVDAAWTFPPPAITAAGSSRVLSTTVTRQTDQSPRAGWIVRYRILDGPAAGFAPDGAQAVDVITDASGRAAVEIFQTQPVAGTNQVGIEVVRPAGLGGLNREIVVDQGRTLQTWSAPDLALRVSGPTQGAVGCTLTYCLNVSNPGDVPADNVVVSQAVPEGLTYTGGSPIATTDGGMLHWRMGTLAAGQVKTIEVGLRALRQGRVDVAATAVADGGLQARAATATEVGSSELYVQILGPTSANVGDQVTFEILVSNRGQATAVNLVITDDFDPGLRHASATSRIRRRLGNLGPGESKRVSVTFRVDSPGLLTHAVEVTGDGGVGAAMRGELSAVDPMGRAAAAPGALPPASDEQPPGTPSGPPTGPPTEPSSPADPAAVAPSGSLSVQVIGQEDGARVGDTVIFDFEITNTSGQTLTQVAVNPGTDGNLTPLTGSTIYLNQARTGWIIPTLAPSQSVSVRFHCQCVAESASAEVTAEATSAEGAADVGRAYLEIRAADTPITSPGGLQVTVTAVQTSQTVGEQLAFRIRVFNGGRGSDEQIVLTVIASEELAIVRLGTRGPLTAGGLVPANFDGQVINFGTLDTLGPNEEVVYRVQLLAREAGMGNLEAELFSRNHYQGLTADGSVTLTAF